MNVSVVIGKNFGDEGKGLATDYFAARAQSRGYRCLVIRHNGGGQAGHTVDLPDKRFVFHQLSSGSFRGADTYWDKTFLPDLYKLPEELADFSRLQTLPKLYGHPMCRCVYIDDVLVNMALETARGSQRHGSCGMGINEAVERSRDPDKCLYLGQIRQQSAQTLYEKLLYLRREYLPQRLAQLGLTQEMLGEYGQLLTDDNVLFNAACQMHQAAQTVTLSGEELVSDYGEVIFEGAQGLLLDEYYLSYAPHLTSSRTGSDNPAAFIRQFLPGVVPEIVYVTRSYVTRHGAGPLPCEENWDPAVVSAWDQTNVHNPWQGTLRYAPHPDRERFFAPMETDRKKFGSKANVSCMVTHLNETEGAICTKNGPVSLEDWFSGTPVDKLYRSFTPFAQDIKE